MKNLILILILVSAFSFNINAQTKSDFCKKWYLDGYIYWGFTISPDDNEKNDYLYFSSDGKYTGIDQGQFDTGSWIWNNSENTIYLIDSKNNKLVLQVEKITQTELIVEAEEDGDRITIKFTSKK
jgi:hypothetical protein